MCDCPQERDDKTVGNTGPQTITIFSKCRTPYRPGKDILQLTAPADSVDYMSIDSSQLISTSSDTPTRDSVHASSTSTESSNESRVYKFVSPRRTPEHLREYPGEEVEPPPEEVVTKLPTICVCEGEKIKPPIIEPPDIEYTLAMIKPEAVIYRKEIEHRILAEGFQICQMRWLQLTPEQVSEFYHDFFGDLNFPHLVAYMSSGPIVVFALGKKDAVAEWKRIIGPSTVAEARLYFPDSIRARYGCLGDSFKNTVHGSSNSEIAEREIHFFFPEFITEPLLRGEMAEEFLWDVINPTLVQGLILCCKVRPIDPVLWLAHWLILNNPNKPKLPDDVALIPT